MIKKQRGRYEITLHPEGKPKRFTEPPSEEALRRGEIRRRLEDKLDEIEAAKGDLW